MKVRHLKAYRWRRVSQRDLLMRQFRREVCAAFKDTSVLKLLDRDIHSFESIYPVVGRLRTYDTWVGARAL